MVNLSNQRRSRRWTGLALVGLAPLGLYTKVYAGPAVAWANNSLGGIFYVLFWDNGNDFSKILIHLTSPLNDRRMAFTKPL